MHLKSQRHPVSVALASMAITTFVALPFSPSIYLLITRGPGCFGAQSGKLHQSALECLGWLATHAPFIAAFGGIALEEDPRPEIWRGSIATAFCIGCIGVLITAASFLMARGKRARD